MVICRSFLLAAASSLITSASLPCLAAPVGGISFTPPLANARTIQVTETVWEARNGSTPGPLQRAGTITFCIARPDKFRMEMKSGSPAKVTGFTVSDGTMMSGYSGDGPTRSQPAQRAEWPLTVMGLLNNTPGSVSAVPAVRGGKQVLLAIRVSDGVREEYWFDPKTHLLLRSTLSGTWQGKTSEILRTEYSNWVLNKLLSPATFRMPVQAKHRQLLRCQCKSRGNELLGYGAQTPNVRLRGHGTRVIT